MNILTMFGPIKSGLVFHRQVTRTIVTTSTNLLNKKAVSKTFTQAHLDKVNKDKLKAAEKKYIEQNPDPLSPLKLFLKAIAAGFVLASLGAVGYGAYDKGYRRTLRTTYPLAAAVLDLFMEKEEETVIDQKNSCEEASIFREEYKDAYKV